MLLVLGKEVRNLGNICKIYLYEELLFMPLLPWTIKYMKQTKECYLIEQQTKGLIQQP